MPNTTTNRMMQIVEDMNSDGLYTKAESVYHITVERDRLIIENARLADALRWERWKAIFDTQ